MEQMPLFSETDLFGTILFVNERFCEISKYGRDELIGKPHSIIRHPDMPGKLFRLLWTTVRKGETFRGVIKNQAKDHSHYWVNAVIMPVLDLDKKATKYISVRHLIEDEKYALDLYNYQVTVHKFF
jgi:methyl-accepting chemotaxis protein